jgi:hypothetical protein
MLMQFLDAAAVVCKSEHRDSKRDYAKEKLKSKARDFKE